MSTLGPGGDDQSGTRRPATRVLPAEYRRDIDGLRAVAVLLVVVYHARFVFRDEPIFPGAYLGVDVFFVISGYLITGVIAKELAHGRFTFRRFYERRIRRIMPALLFLLAVAVPVGFVTMSPRALQEFSGAVPAALLSYANVFYYLQDSYAAEPSQLKPLLHTWSLAVEEQFYLVFPPLMALLWRVGKFVRGLALGSLAVASLVLAQTLATRNSDANFFLAPTRGWELLAGSLLALYAAHLRSILDGLGRWLPTLGLIAIVISSWRFDDNSLHPSLATLLPVLGSVAIIGFPDDRSWTTRLLSTRFLVGIGLISYSLYLWHFTIFAFGRITGDGRDGLAERLVWILLSFVMAYVSWRFVEQPVRRPGLFPVRKLILAVSAAAVVLGGVTAVQATRDPLMANSNIPEALQDSFETWQDPYSGRQTCVDQSDILNPANWCRLGIADDDVDFLVVGDSHAHAQAAVFDAGAGLAQQTGLLVSKSGCPLLVDLEPARGSPDSQDCLDLADRVLVVAQALEVDRVIFVSRWNYYTCGEPRPDCGFTQIVRYRDAQFGDSIEQRARFMKDALTDTVEAYEAVGITVDLLAQVPHQIADPRAIFDDAFRTDDPSLLERRSVEHAAHLGFTADMRRLLDDVVNESDRATVLDQTSDLCVVGGRCVVGTAEGSLYSDDDHLSVGAADLLQGWSAHVLDPQAREP